MRVATAHLESLSPYSQSQPVDVPKLDKEGPADYDERTWRERVHVDDSGFVFIPPMAFKNCLSEIAKFLGLKIPGQRNATYTKHFEAGVMVVEGLRLPIAKADVASERLFVPSDGVRGSGKRVWKRFPLIPSWRGAVTFHILDDTIKQDVFEHHLREAGSFIGIGRFRPRQNGYYGRFKVTKVSWS